MTSVLNLKTKTPGIFITGCSEKQISHKVHRLSANESVDPWTFALIKVIQSSIKPGRAVPTYESLFNKARKFIKDEMNIGNISYTKYLGPSDDENNPSPMANINDSSTGASNQDPQMIFLNGYVKIDSERFCCPFSFESSGRILGEFTRYPKDEFYEP